MFVNRATELSLLEKYHASNQAEIFILYGRRCVGKTELLSHFCKGKRAIFFVADQVSESALRANLSAVINAALFGSGQVGAVYNTWEDLFTTLAHQAQSERLVLVLDEFPYMVAAHPPLASILQRFWDQTFKNTQIMLILCGSHIGMMEETVLGYRAPLDGRRIAQYLLEPLEFFDAQFFFEKFKPDDRLRTYAVYGGTPAFLQTIRPGQTLESNILNGILERGSLLYDEVRFLLQQELREPRNYYAVLQAIAGGNIRPNGIKQAAGLDNITAYLETLQQLHLVERSVPVTETQPHKSRRGIYRLKDNFLRFWFRFVLPNWSQLERGASSVVWEAAIAPELDHFSAPIFEQVCQQYFWREGLAGRLHFIPEKVGSWWQANQEINLVLLGAGNGMLVECKWTSRPVGIDIFQELKGKTSAILPEMAEKKITYALCSRLVSRSSWMNWLERVEIYIYIIGQACYLTGRLMLWDKTRMDADSWLKHGTKNIFRAQPPPIFRAYQVSRVPETNNEYRTTPSRPWNGPPPPRAARANRIVAGHPEGFHEGFANLYTGAAEVIVARRAGTPVDRLALYFPNSLDGLLGVGFVHSVIKSSQADGKWVKC